jgi:hypothetical protein
MFDPGNGCHGFFRAENDADAGRSFAAVETAALGQTPSERREVVMFILSLLMHPAGLVLVAMFVIGHALTRSLLGSD